MTKMDPEFYERKAKVLREYNEAREAARQAKASGGGLDAATAERVQAAEQAYEAMRVEELPPPVEAPADESEG